MTEVYTRSELGGGGVQFWVGPASSNNLLIPTIAALSFVFVASQVMPWMPAVIVLGAGAFVFHRVRRRLKWIDENRGSLYVASPTGFTIRDRTIAREQIKDVTFMLGSKVGVGGHLHPIERPSDCSVHLSTVSGERWPLAGHMQEGPAEGLARGIAEALGGVPVSGVYSPILRG